MTKVAGTSYAALVRVDVYHHFDGDDAVLALVREIAARLANVERLTRRLIKQQTEEAGVMRQDFEDLKAAVANQTTVEAGVVTLIGQAVAKLDDLAQRIADAVDPAEVQSLTAELMQATAALSSGAGDLARAVTANTQPPAPAPPPPNPEPAPGAGQGGEGNTATAVPSPAPEPFPTAQEVAPESVDSAEGFGADQRKG